LCAPGDEARVLAGGVDAELDAALAALREAGDAGVVIAGERDGAADPAWAVAGEVGARFAFVTRRANDRGALRAGVHPALLPGGRTFDEADEVEAAWGPLMNREPGYDAHSILRACADREIDVLFCVGVDPMRDLPDAALAQRALQNVERVVVQSLELGSLEPFASAFLPAAPFIEKEGHVTTWEGRGQRLQPIRGAQGISLPDWEIFASMALACGGDLGFETLDELHEEMGSLLAPRRVGIMTSRELEPRGAAGLQLFTYPLLIDDGRLSDRADELEAALGTAPFAEIHPEDAATAGVADGASVIVRTDAGEATLPAHVTDHVARGAVFVPFNQPGFAANTLLSGRMTAPVELEAIDVPEAEDAGSESAGAEPVGSASGGAA
jgi:formate dehydrogenase major subunit